MLFCGVSSIASVRLHPDATAISRLHLLQSCGASDKSELLCIAVHHLMSGCPELLHSVTPVARSIMGGSKMCPCGCGSKNRNSKMACPGKWKHGYQNLRFAPSDRLLLSHTHVGNHVHFLLHEGGLRLTPMPRCHVRRRFKLRAKARAHTHSRRALNASMGCRSLQATRKWGTWTWVKKFSGDSSSVAPTVASLTLTWPDYRADDHPPTSPTQLTTYLDELDIAGLTGTFMGEVVNPRNKLFPF